MKAGQPVAAMLAGQMALPLVIVTLLGVIYERFAAVPAVHAALVGAAAGAAGLVLGTALKMARRIHPAPAAVVLALSGFAAIGVLQWPLVPVVAVLVALGVGVAAWQRRRAG
jgi:chromate transporter